MFTWLKEKNWRNSLPHMHLLSNFLRFDAPSRYENAEYWSTALQETPQSAIERFLKEGILEKAVNLNDLLDFKFKASDVKAMLKARNLKISGDKATMIARLADSAPEEMKEITKDIILFRCSAAGKEIAERYLEAEKNKKSLAEQEVLLALENKEFSRAAKIVADYEAAQVFPRGIGIDWNKYDTNADVRSLEVIFNETPGILKGMQQAQLQKLRVAAAMMHLWGTNRARPWLPDGFETGIHLDADSATSMIVSYCWYKKHLAEYKKRGLKTVEVSGANDKDTCSECRQISGKKYPLDKVPELPCPKCTCTLGCGCQVLPVVE